jgi:cytochrome c nitrite reductase small subunit
MDSAPMSTGSSRLAEAQGPQHSHGLLMAALAVTLGALVGVGTWTFGYAHGLSYFSKEPQACANCHIMQDYYNTWQKSSHHHVAVCIDCHLPHDFVGKYIAKADNGFFHSMAFTLDNFHEPIRIKARNRRITQNNCIACHKDIVHQMLPEDPDGEALMCIHCHAGVGHGG